MLYEIFDDELYLLTTFYYRGYVRKTTAYGISTNDLYFYLDVFCKVE